MLEMTSARRCCWCARAYSMPRMPPPRLAEKDEVVAVQPQRLADLLDLVHEPVKLPQRRLVGLVAETRAELVVVVVLHPGRGQEAVAGLQVLVGGSGPAVQQEHPEPGVVADPLHPYVEGALRRV